ncbi:hypothetical protein HanIR_Chr16g0810901 [Helianthus annuus]|nr:hypothetical protein HanIR_Chr16g0810901 [Helianthus annuus]
MHCPLTQHINPRYMRRLLSNQCETDCGLSEIRAKIRKNHRYGYSMSQISISIHLYQFKKALTL